MSKIVFRVENQNGTGPYSAGASIELSGKGNDTSRNPVPFHDPLLRPYFGIGLSGAGRKLGEVADWPTAKFGFADPDQLKIWFTAKDRRKLNKLGFAVGIYEAPDDAAIIGATQAVFDKTKATRVDVVKATHWDRPVKVKPATPGQLNLFDLFQEAA